MSRLPDSKPFPWKCGHCRQKEVWSDQVSYTTDVEHEGRICTVTVDNLKTPRCRVCGEMVLDTAANRQISEALRRQLGLLTPEQVRQNREALGLTQGQLAGQLGIAEAALAHLEDGVQIQPRALDNLMRLFFALPDVRSVLGQEQRAAEWGATVLAALPLSAP